MPFTQITSTNISNGSITFAQTAAGAFTLLPTITNVQIADASYNVLDDTAANTSGGFIVVTGTNFGSNSRVIIGSNNATSTTVVNTTTIRAQVPASVAATYPVYVVDNSNGATAIRVNGLTYSSFPAWSTGSTLSNQSANTSFSVNLSATSDSSVTYSNTTALPAGTTLAANGLFSGTVTIGAQTTYSFDIKATDSENQDATQTFSLTVTINIAAGLYAWGRNDFGQLGLNDRVYRSSPAQVGVATNWSQISVSRLGGAAIKTNGTLWTWGFNFYGNLGTSNTVYRSSPVQVGVATNWSLVSMGMYGALAIKTNGTLWTWGGNLRGQLGLNETGNYRSSPTQVGVSTNWSRAIMSPDNGNAMVIAVKTDSTLWTWGYNGTGNLGTNNIGSYKSSPVQVGSGTDWNQIAVDRFNAAATKTNGTLWMWSNNSQGQLGLNDRVSRSSPTQVGVATNWSKISIGEDTHIIAIKTDGTLWAWGRGTGGGLGLNDTVFRSSPTQVGTDTNWNLVSIGNYNTAAIKTNGTLWVWGSSQSGQSGLNSSGIYRSSPVQVGGSANWSLLSARDNLVMAIAT